MRRLGIVAVGLVLVVAMAGSTRGAAQSPPPPATIFQACSVTYPGSVAVTFAWPPTTGALQQWADLSLSDNGFLPDTFLGAGSVVSTRYTHNTFTWDGILPGLPHFYRINVLYPDGWVAVAQGSFVSIGDCPKPTASEGKVASVECEVPYSMRVTFSWVPGGGASQWLDYNYNTSVEDMAWGSYWSQGPLAPGTNSFELLLGASGYSWRVNTLSAEAWSPSPIWFLDGLSLCGLQAPPAAPPAPVPPPAPTPIPPPVPPPGPPPGPPPVPAPPYPIGRDRCAMALYDWAQSYYLSPSAELQIELYCGESPEVYVKGSTFPVSAERCAMALYDWAQSGFLSPAAELYVDLWC